MKNSNITVCGMITILIAVQGCISGETSQQVEMDRQVIAQMTMEWAVLGGHISDYMINNGSVMVSSKNINKSYNFSYGDVPIIILTPKEIQKKSDDKGHYMYLEFETLDIKGTSATVNPNSIWAVSEKRPEDMKWIIRGSGSTIRFKKDKGRWVRQDNIEGWIS